MTRNQIIEVFVVRAAPADREELRRKLERMTWDELEQAHQAAQAQTQLREVDEELARIAVEREADRIWHQESMRLAREPQRKAEEKAQLEQDRDTFRQAARKYGLSDIEANFNVVRSVLGSGFDAYQIGQAVASNAASLVPASQAELEQRAREDQEQRQDYLIHQASPLQLREIANTEAEQRRVQFQREQTERQIATRAQIDASQGYAPLPETTSDGTKIDAHFLKSLKTDIYRNYLRKYGATAITARLNGIQ